MVCSDMSSSSFFLSDEDSVVYCPKDLYLESQTNLWVVTLRLLD